MTVKEAIENLKQFPENLELIVPDNYVNDIAYPRTIGKFEITYLGIERKYINNIEYVRK